MALTNLQRFRLRAQDPYRNFSESFWSDGAVKDYDLRSYPIQSGVHTAYVDGIAKTPTTDYTISWDDGRLTFVVSPPSGAEVRFVGRYSIFSDTEMDAVLGDHGLTTGASGATFAGLDGSVLTVVEILLGDAWKRHNWAAAGGQSVSEGTLFQNLKAWRDILVTKQRGAAEIGPEGGLVSWSDSQDEYGDDYSV